MNAEEMVAWLNTVTQYGPKHRVWRTRRGGGEVTSFSARNGKVHGLIMSGRYGGVGVVYFRPENFRRSLALFQWQDGGPPKEIRVEPGMMDPAPFDVAAIAKAGQP